MQACSFKHPLENKTPNGETPSSPIESSQKRFKKTTEVEKEFHVPIEIQARALKALDDFSTLLKSL
jgi:hypothetical protein